jgi:PAS domain S-box-containing protein
MLPKTHTYRLSLTPTLVLTPALVKERMPDALPHKPLMLPVPANEAERLAALHRYKVLDTPPEAAFDRITNLAARLFNMPIALISFVDESRAWFKSCIGFGTQEVPRDDTLCNFAVLANEPLIIPDARLDDRFACNPLVQSEPGVRFYAGAPLLSQDGFNLGTLCLLDSQPREPFTPEQQATLVDLAAMVMDELELRLAAYQITQVDAALLEVTQGTSAVTGNAFFSALVQHLAKALDMNYACISLLEDKTPQGLKTIAFCAQGEIQTNVEYSLQNTPCLEVIRQQKLCCYPQGIQALFPQDSFLASLAIESYAAMPFFDSMGNLLGLLSVMDSKPLENQQLVQSLLTILAMRIAAEVERQQAVERLQLYADVVRNTQVGVVVWQLEDLNNPSSFRLLIANPAASETTGFDFKPLIGKTMAEGFPMLLQKPLVQQYMDVVRTGQALDLGEVAYSDDGIAAGIYSLKAFALPDHCLGLAFENITARKRIETQLHESQHYNQQIAETLPGVLFVHDLIEQRNVYTNRQIAELLGYTSEQVQAMGANALPILIHPDDLNRVFNYIEAFRSAPEGTVLGIEYRAHHVSGEWRWMYSQSVVFNRTAEGLPRQILGVSIDISDRKQTEAALRESEERLRTLTATIPQLIWTALPDGSVNYLSEQWADYIGLPPERLYDWNWQQVVHPDDLPNTLRDWEHSLQLGEPLEIQHRFRNHTGEWRWQLVRGIPIRDGMGQITKWVGTCTDIQREVDIKTALQVSEEQSRSILVRERHYMNQLQGLTTAASAINSALSVEEVLQIITEQAATIIGAHQSVTSMTINQNWAQAINAIYLSDKYAQWQDYDELTDGSGIYARVCHLNRSMRMTQAELEAHPQWKGFGKAVNNHPPMRGWLAAPLIGREGHNIGLIQLSDKYEGEFTETDESILVQLAQMASVAVENARLYEAEQQARLSAQAAREEAEQANRVKDEFLAVLSHELRSPLNPILGWSTLLQSKKLDEAKTAHALATIQRNAKLQSELIEDLLDVSRILRGKLSLNVAPVNLTTVIRAAMETVRLAAEAKSIQLEANLASDVGLVSGDSTRLQQVIWNLLSNAVKFTPAGGQVNIHLERHDSYAQITVSDTGQGIEPDFLPYVFDYFRQADAATTRKFGGLGLGLAIVRHLVELHGGTVRVESPGVGMGATFRVKLLLMPTQPTIQPSERSSNSVSNLDGVRVLVVDDETDSREFIAFVLAQAGVEVMTAIDAHEALAMLARFQPDILLSDIGMPDMDGYMLIQQVRALAPDQGGQIPAIALTAYAGDFNQQQALAAGFQRHLAKPIEPETLVATIVTLLSEVGD